MMLGELQLRMRSGCCSLEKIRGKMVSLAYCAVGRRLLNQLGGCLILLASLLFWTATAFSQPTGPGATDPGALPPASTFNQPPPPSAPLSPGVMTPAPMSTPGGGIMPEIPDFHLTQVQIEAQVATDRVNLVATIELVINRGEGWHRVPLRLGSAHVTSREYTGSGGESPDVSPRATDDGLVWLFRGIGRHQMKIHAWIPLRPTASGGQFQLSLPRLPPQFEARVQVRIPDAHAIVRSSKSLTILDIRRVDGETTVDASVIGHQLLFSWQTPAVAGEAISLVQSWFHLKPATEHLSLVVEQNFELQQTSADSLLISLPADFRVTQVSGQNFRMYEPVPDRPNWVRVHFTNDNIGRLQLRWVLERDFKHEAQTLQIEGFHVEGAVREEGLIRIDEFENLRVVPRPADSPLVHRIGVNLVRSLGTGVPLSAFEYLKQPFRLTFDIQPTAPYYIVEPRQQLRFEPDATELKVRAAVRIERGSISELKLNWPNWLKQGWRVQGISAEAEAIGPVSYDATSEPNVIRLWWPNPLSHDAVFTVTFRRMNTSDMMEEQELRNAFRLPSPQASEVTPTILTVSSADQLSVEFTHQDGHPLPLSNATAVSETQGVAPGVESGHEQQFRLDDLSQLFAVKLESHPREIQAVTEIALNEAGPTRLMVEQNIDFQVSYGRLRQLELVLPAPLMAKIPDWAVTQGVDVIYQGKKLPIQQGAAPNILKVDLGEDRIGHFRVQIAYGYPIPDDDTTREIDVPVVALNQIPFGRAECLIDTLETLQVRSENTGWEALRTSPSQVRWINPLKDGRLTFIPVSVGPKLADSSQQYVVQEIQVRTIFTAEGMAESWAEFQLNSPPSRILIQFPAKTEFKERAFFLDGQPLPVAAQLQRSGGVEEVTLTLPNKVSSQPKISVRYRTPLEHPFRLANRISLPLPVFPRSVWVDETIWEMQLPDGQHLFTYPDLLPQIQWVRRLLFWYREPTASYLAERAARDQQNVPQEFRFENTNFYAFHGFGPVRQIEFQVMNRSLILLLGAGFALLLGFIFWRIPATRNVFSLIVISFVFAAASLWYVEPILLLLQPAILGIVLALTATIIDSHSRPNNVEYSTLSADVLRPTDSKLEDPSSRSAATRLYRPVSATKPRGQD